MGFDYLYPLRCMYHTWLDWQDKRIQRRNVMRFWRGKFAEKKAVNPRTAYLIMTPEHENIGDHAIAYAEEFFLKKHGIDYVEITGSRLESLRDVNGLSVMNGHPILFQGGGYLGTLWFDSEKLLRQVIRENPRSPIILLPNTIYYEPDDWGKEEFENSKVLYSHHRKLHIYARERQSFMVMEKAYPHVKLVPDMVLSMDGIPSEAERRGCLLSLRSDVEKTRTEEQEKRILQQVKSLFGENVRNSDMVADHWIPVERRETELKAKFAEFAGAELVVTDRLHGMIFCAVTGTPCIVINSKSPKVRGCYEWIRNLDYIRFAEDPSRIGEEYEKIPKGRHVFDNSHLHHYYAQLAEDIETIFRWR